MAAKVRSIFDGMSAREVEQLSGRLLPRRFDAGAIVLAEGDGPHAIYIIQSGLVDVFLIDHHGHEHLLNRLGPGATLGEMSVLTGRPAAASVRAVTDLEVLVLPEADFERTATAFPRLYHNLGAILSERLALSNQRGVRSTTSNLSVLLDLNAPPLLGYALACSLAWHIRAPTALLVATDRELPAELVAFMSPSGTRPDTATRTGSLEDAVPTGARAVLHSAPSSTAPASVHRLIDDLSDRYDHVLVQVQGERPPAGLMGRVLRLSGVGTVKASPNSQVEFTIEAWADARQWFVNHAGVLRVPALNADDHESLRTGVLPPVTHAGRSLGWAARHLAGLKVGLALGGGSIKGYAHIGVLEVLNRAGIMVDYVSGTSVGAAVAGLLATGYTPAEIARVLDDIGSTLFRPNVPMRSLLSNAGLREGVQRVAGSALIENLDMPLGVVAVDIVTRREIVFRKGPLWQAVLASMSIPGIYPPVRMDQYLLVDGGLLNPVPSDVAGEMGANQVIAVKLAAPPASIESASERRRRLRPTVLQALLRSIETMQSRIGTDTASTATILIEPTFPEGVGGWWDLRRFTQGRRYIELGERAAETALPRIAAALPWVQTK